MHHHLGSAFFMLGGFLSVIIVGTFWRLAALHMATARSTQVQKFGRTMLFQY